ncbi:unnamed protein product [Effrenium voratum]|nr:unnamed protein product [Effrenium voratum]CAJ1455151.1 unnamed protein product [Effrenium voratum]
MQHAWSDSRLFNTRRSPIGDHIGGAAPGYAGHVPCARLEGEAVASTFGRSLRISQGVRSQSTCDVQAMRLQREEQDRRTRTLVPRSLAPEYDKRGIGYQPAGDTQQSRIPDSNEDKRHYHSDMGLTSLAHENLGGASKLRGRGAAARGVSGYMGFVPGKASENTFAETWSKTQERSLASHLEARAAAPKQFTLLTQGRTSVGPVRSDTIAEMPIWNPSYQDQARGWSDCEVTGKHVLPAGSNAPVGQHEAFNMKVPPLEHVLRHGVAPILGYKGYIPGKVSENVIGERQCKTVAIADRLHRKARLRITQR